MNALILDIYRPVCYSTPSKGVPRRGPLFVCPATFGNTGVPHMEIRLRPILLILLLAAAAIAAAAIGLPRLGIDPLAFGRAATPTVQAAITQTRAAQRITFADDSAAWDWQPVCQDALAAWVQQSPYPIRTIRVTLTDDTNLGVATVGVGYPGIADQAAIAYAACDGQPEMTCRVAIKQGTPGADLDVAVTAAIPHAIRNAWLIHSPGGAEQIAALRKNWSWDQFQPLLRKEGASWRSSCLSVFQP